MTWDEIIGRLLLCGLSREDIGNLTLRNAYQIIYAREDEMLFQARLAGAEIDDEGPNEVSAENAAWLESLINASIRGGS